MKKLNNAGFSLIEVIVIAAIMITFTGISVGSATFVYRARSLEAAKIVDSMISQSKVNALSNRKNRLELSYDNDRKCYECKISRGHYNDEGKWVSEIEYSNAKASKIGNERLDVIVGGVSLKDGGKLTMSFNMDTGAVKEFKVGDTDKLADVMTINLNSYTNHSITLYKDTGEHTFE